MIRELPSAILEIAGLLFFGWTIYFLANLIMSAA
jgi:hypothetical protein